MGEFFKNFFGISKKSNFNRIGFFQIISQTFAGIMTFIVTLSGIWFFVVSFKDFFCANKDFYILIKGLLSSFEMLFMAPIPFLIIFSHKRNIQRAFSELIPVVQQREIAFTDTHAKKLFVSSIIGVLITFILKQIIDILPHELTGNINKSPLFELLSNNFWIGFIVIGMLFLFLIILIYYYKLLSTKHEDRPNHNNN
jgi:ABC-type uncharacterized transport system YnjBCD permease subunit